MYNTIFEDVGGHEAHGLVAAAKPPGINFFDLQNLKLPIFLAHFIAMLDLLGLRHAYKDFMNRSEKPSEDSSSSTSRTSGDVVF